MEKIHYVKVNPNGRNQGCDIDIDKFRVKVTFFIVQYQNEYEDLPPYVWHLDRVFLSKSQAIAYVQSKLRMQDPCDPDDQVTYRVMVQHDHLPPMEGYSFVGGKVQKIKEA